MSEQPAKAVPVEASQKRVRAYLGADLVADSHTPWLVWEHDKYPAYYFPAADVVADLIPAGRAEHLARLGDAELLHVKTPTATAEGAARRYQDAPVPELRDAVRLEWSAMSEWLEEEEPVYVHPRDPHKRVDILASSRRIRVALDGVTVAESSQPRALFETGLPPRYYLPLTDLRRELLRESEASSMCPYKGTAAYWSVDTSVVAERGRVHKDVVWIYRAPLPESQKIAGLACFYNERVDLYVDGELVPRPKTPFS